MLFNAAALILVQGTFASATANIEIIDTDRESRHRRLRSAAAAAADQRELFRRDSEMSFPQAQAEGTFTEIDNPPSEDAMPESVETDEPEADDGALEDSIGVQDNDNVVNNIEDALAMYHPAWGDYSTMKKCEIAESFASLPIFKGKLDIILHYLGCVNEPTAQPTAAPTPAATPGLAKLLEACKVDADCAPYLAGGDRGIGFLGTSFCFDMDFCSCFSGANTPLGGCCYQDNNCASINCDYDQAVVASYGKCAPA